jgi:hypothetical protein
MSNNTITRRQLIKNTATFAIGSAIYLNSPVELWGQTKGAKTRVVLIRDERLPGYGIAPNPEIVKEMLNKAVCALLDEKDTASAWKKIIKPSDIVGIKTNVWKNLATPAELENAIKDEVLNAGVASENIAISDRQVRSMDVFKNSTALINVRPMRTHAWSGVGSLIKNYIMFAAKPPEYHDDSCANLATLWDLPEVKGKTRLNILVMFTPQFQSVGPHSFSPDYVWEYKGLLVGLDPVAVDSVGLRIINAKRNQYFKEERPLNPPAKHIELADTEYKLGTADPKKIELIKLGWDKGLLI